ncbi:MAG: Phosphohydrolase [Caulobacteraceae bacterium]|nr:Phosphohydrolase [Caulobacteraceae bacterium]
MGAKQSAGLLVFRRRGNSVEFLLAHPGGPFWKHRDEGAWSIPKGLIDQGEESQAAAEREFEEEVGQCVAGDFIALAPCRQKSGKVIHCWMVEADLDLSGFRSNTFELEWPRGSGRMTAFPEIDRVAYLAPDCAFRKILPGQAPLIAEALERLGVADERGGRTTTP